MLRGRDRVFFAYRPWVVDFCCSTLSKSSMILSCWRRAYSPLVKSPRRAGVAGGVREGEFVRAGGVLEGDATVFSKDAGLRPRGKELKIFYARLQLSFGFISSHMNKSKQDRFFRLHVCVCYLFSLSCSCHCLLFFSSSLLFCCFSNKRALRWAISSSLCISSYNHTSTHE